jgi:glycosyltransferase involved in cell wall biosynthesis
MRINILYLFHVSTYGGGSLCLLNIIKELDKEKYKPIVLLKQWGPLCEDLIIGGAEVFIEPSINTVPYNSSLFKISSIRQSIGVLISMRKIKYWIRNTKAKIVHLNTMMMYPYAIPAKKMGCKTVIHIREHWPIKENIFQFKFAKKIIDRYSDSIIAINKTSCKMINLPNKTEIIYDWIDFDNRDEFMDFKTIFGSNYKELKVFLFLGGIQIIKGSIEVVSTFKKIVTDSSARLLVVGIDTNSKLSKGVKYYLKKVLNKFNYFTYSDKIKKIIKSDNRIICIPATSQVKSLFEQSFCTVVYPTVPHAIIPIAESIYLGKPILSAKTPESLEYSNQGEGAKLFKINSIVEFQKEFIYMYNNEEIINKNAQLSSKHIQELFSKEKNSNKLNQLYNRILYS